MPLRARETSVNHSRTSRRPGRFWDTSLRTRLPRALRRRCPITRRSPPAVALERPSIPAEASRPDEDAREALARDDVACIDEKAHASVQSGVAEHAVGGAEHESV